MSCNEFLLKFAQLLFFLYEYFWVILLKSILKKSNWFNIKIVKISHNNISRNRIRRWELFLSILDSLLKIMEKRQPKNTFTSTIWHFGVINEIFFICVSSLRTFSFFDKCHHQKLLFCVWRILEIYALIFTSHQGYKLWKTRNLRNAFT